MAQWVKNSTRVAWVTAEVWISSWLGAVVKSSSIAVAQMQSLAWELPYATDVAIRKSPFKNIIVYYIIMYNKYTIAYYYI